MTHTVEYEGETLEVTDNDGETNDVCPDCNVPMLSIGSVALPYIEAEFWRCWSQGCGREVVRS